MLFVLYLLSLLFTMKTHRQLFTVADPDAHHHEAGEKRSIWPGLMQLTGIAVVLAVVSKVMTDALDPALASLHFSETFAGIIVLGSLGNVAQLIGAIRCGRADKMDLAMSSTISATQASLAMAPLLAFAGQLFDAPMDLLFSDFEVLAIALQNELLALRTPAKSKLIRSASAAKGSMRSNRNDAAFSPSAQKEPNSSLSGKVRFIRTSLAHPSRPAADRGRPGHSGV